MGAAHDQIWGISKNTPSARPANQIQRISLNLTNEIAGIALRNPSHRLFPKRPGEEGNLAEYEKMKNDYPERF
ncbi:MAG: hypothetical protein ACR2KT_00470 [Methylocella sp.]